MRRATPPPKPYPDFPLFAHKNGQWRKDIWQNRKSVPYYFGPWADDPKGEWALKEWLARKDAIYAGLDRLRVEGSNGALLLLQLGRKFLEVRHADLLAGTLADETFKDYVRELQGFINIVGADANVAALKPEHFGAYGVYLRDTRKLGPHAMKRTIAYVKAMFNYAAGEGWIPAPAFGNGFKAPSTTPEALAIAKMRAGGNPDEELIYEPKQVATLLRMARRKFRAMTLLGLNLGMGPSDIARLKWADIDFESGRLSTHRGKTGVKREAYLWKRTRKALLALPRKGELVFYTRNGKAYVRRERVMQGGKVAKVRVTNAISGPYAQLLKRAKVDGLTFYNLRHTYRTHADNCPDTAAVDRTMGHAMKGSARKYVRRPMELWRLKKVAKVVYKRLFPKPKPVASNPATAEQPLMRLAGAGNTAAA